MFTGLVEAHSKVLNFHSRNDVSELHIAIPDSFNDIEVGDSIATNGVCLTVESFDSEKMVFALGPETLKLTVLNNEYLAKINEVNLERSLRFGDRVHGHLVTGHVDAVGSVDFVQELTEAWILNFNFPKNLKPYIWKKGSIAINGVSLTVNDVSDLQFSVCLIPETLKKTNLSFLKKEDLVNLEVDSMARAWVHNMPELAEERGC